MKKMTKKLKTAAYARVSTDKDNQINSLENQKSFFEEYIRSRPDMEFAGIFFDEGVTGTQTRRRTGFTRMIEKCRAGEIDLVLTKEVSRFARNTVDALNYTRMLRDYGVGVIFINDGIDTRDNDGEFRLSIMASVAQEESRKISERVKWGQRRAMEKGVVFGNNSIFGFDLKNGVLTVNEREAEAVRLIFRKYADERKGTHIIARELTEEGICPPALSGAWSGAMVLKILKNEKYAGDLLQKKYITKNYLTHKKVVNTGEKILIKNHHEPIVSRAVWEKAQTELQKRRRAALDSSRHSGRYWCSGKIVCGECGAPFAARRSLKKSGIYTAWMCRSRMRGKCGMRTVNNKSLLECMRFICGIIGIDFEAAAKKAISELRGDSESVRETESRLKAAERKKLRMLDSYCAGVINADEMAALAKRYDAELARLSNILKDEKENVILREKSANDLLSVIHKDIMQEYIFAELLEKITIYEDYIVIRLKALNFAFKIRYSVHGYKENYTTAIEKWETENS